MLLDKAEVPYTNSEVFSKIPSEAEEYDLDQGARKGIYSSWREMLGNLPMPQMVEATLIPFQGEIIHDGLIHPYGVCMGKNLADEAKNIYLDAKDRNEIYTCL